MAVALRAVRASGVVYLHDEAQPGAGTVQNTIGLPNGEAGRVVYSRRGRSVELPRS